MTHRRFSLCLLVRLASHPVLVAAGLLLSLSGCVHEVEDGADLVEPEDLKDNLDLQGLYDCTERSDTGYRSGSSFSIGVVTVDGRPVESDTANAYIALQRAAANDGVSLRIVSGFRTHDEQRYLYGCYTSCTCNSCNLAARPGYSNHQSGHALDLNTSESGVLSWLNRRGAEFGFRRTVPSENWHWEWWGNGSDFPGPCGHGVSDVDSACGQLPAEGGTVDDGDNCFDAGGPTQTLRAVDEGQSGDLLWTGATANTNPVNFAVWNLNLAEAGEYNVEVFVQGTVASSNHVKYAITHAGVTNTVMLDQSGSNRWIPIGTWAFNAGGAQRIRVNDNTGESSSLGKKVVFDAVRLTRVVSQPLPSCPYLEVTTSGGPLNVRPTPSTERSPLAALDNGAVVLRLQTVQGASVSGSRDWHRIQRGSVAGYISAAFATCRNTP